MNQPPPPYSQTPPFGGTGPPSQIPPPPPGYYPGSNNFSSGMTPAVVQTYPGPGPIHNMRSKNPTRAKCQHCNQEVVSHPEARPGGMTWLICIFIALIGFPCGCCLIPFCIDDCKNFHHKCPNCQKLMYVYSPL